MRDGGQDAGLRGRLRGTVLLCGLPGAGVEGRTPTQLRDDEGYEGKGERELIMGHRFLLTFQRLLLITIANTGNIL